MYQQFNGGTMEEQRIKALIIYYEDSIRIQKKLLDCHFAETIMSIIPNCMKNSEVLSTQLGKMEQECDVLKSTLELAVDRVEKFRMKYSENTVMKEFLEFTAALHEFRDFNDDINTTSNIRGKEKAIQHFGISSDIYCAKELNKDKHGATSRSGEVTDRGTCSMLPANVINEDLLTLNSKLESAEALLNAEKLQSNKLKCERDSLDKLSEKLCCLLFEYQKRISIPAEKSKTRDEPSNDKDRPHIKAVVCDSSTIIRIPRISNRKPGKRFPKPENKVINFRCDRCNVTCTRKADLKRHILRLHEKEKSHTCPVCGKQFSHKSNMKVHTLIHGSERPFECAVCHKKFKLSYVMKRHQRRVHEIEGEARYQCTYCNKRYYQKAILMSHILRHEWESRRMANRKRKDKCD